MMTREQQALDQIKALADEVSQAARRWLLIEHKAIVQTILRDSEARTHRMLDDVYGEKMWKSYIRACVEDLGYYITTRRTEKSLRELELIFGGTALDGLLAQEWSEYRRDFRRYARKTKRNSHPLADMPGQSKPLPKPRRELGCLATEIPHAGPCAQADWIAQHRKQAARQ
jgi:hypothetical protein